MNTIRASSLPSFQDCGLRQAAQNWPKLFNEKGHELRRLGKSVGSILGSSVHRAVLPVLFDEGVDAALKAGREYLDEQQAAELIFDPTTPNIAVAREQSDRIIKVIAASSLMLLEPALIEGEIKATLDDETELTGHPDLITTDGEIHDLKTGKLARPYHTQLGAYSLLARSNGYHPTRLIVDYVGRRKHATPEFEVSEYPLIEAEKSARVVIKRVAAELKEFTETGETAAFLPNPLSMMCSELYCGAWGTNTCTQWTKKED